MNDFDEYRVRTGRIYEPCWRYEFPNRHGVYIRLDDSTPFRFVFAYRVEPDIAFGQHESGLSSDEVVAKLQEIAAEDSR